MMMNTGMIPIGAHGPSGASPMVPVGGMPQNNRHMNPAMQGDCTCLSASFHARDPFKPERCKACWDVQFRHGLLFRRRSAMTTPKQRH